MKAPLYILFGALITVVTATALGMLLLRALSLELYRLEERLLGFLTGAACLSGVMFALCAVHLVHKGVLLAITAIVVGAAIHFRVHGPPARPPIPNALPPVPTLWKWTFGIPFAIFTALYFINAMAPERSPDGSAYHLAFVADYARAHGFVRITTNIYANISQGVEMLFLFAYCFGRHSAAALVHFSFLAVLPWLMLCYARRFGLTVAGVAAAIFVYASPVFGMDGTIAYVDVALAAVLFGLFYFLQIWARTLDNRLLIPIGILTGFSFAIKITAVFAIPYAFGFIVWKLWRARRPMLRPALITFGLALLFMAPWPAKNWLWIGNPVTPFANRLFPNPYVHVSFEDEYRKFQRVYGLKSYAQIPFELTVGGGALTGLFGPLFLLAPIALLALRSQQGRQLLLAAAVFAAGYYNNVGTRFLIPAAPFLALAMAVAMMRLPLLLITLATAHALASWPTVLERYCSPAAWRFEHNIPWKAALRIESEDGYLSRKLPGYAMNRMVEQIVPPDAKIFSMSQVCEAYTTRHFLVKYLSAQNEVLADMLLTPLYADFQPSRLLTFRFPERIATRMRVVQTARTKDAIWSMSELRIFDGRQELPRAPQWRLAAQPNPWDVQLAFDNDPDTRWRSWQAAMPGMHVDVDFGGPQKLDRVTIETSRDWQELQVRLETMDAAGKWASAGGEPEDAERPITVSLRRAAVEELKLRGVRYLVVENDDLGAADFHQHAIAWGIRLIGEKGSYRVYYLE